MTDPPSKDKKDFVTGVDSNARKSPRRVARSEPRNSSQESRKSTQQPMPSYA